ncbi:MAG: hypothetical protein PHV77_04790 [Candidatus Omnitrophica bacterium]|jgi:hypothetical protein|nr:hypothetical protein [Candidatus Omnitrophota bacterium]
MDKQTSDERLLKLLEGQYSSTHGPLAPSQPAQHPKPAKRLGIKPVSRLNILKPFLRLKIAKFDLAYINKSLFALAFLLSAVFFYILFVSPALSGAAGAILHPADITQIQRLIKASHNQLEMRGNISEAESERDIFLPFGVKSAYEEEQEINIEDELGIYKLVGIIWSQVPEAIIESEMDTRTLVVKKGDTLGDKCTVKDVLRNSVILQVSTKDGLRDYELR